jgi:hypothetical protein
LNSWLASTGMEIIIRYVLDILGYFTIVRLIEGAIKEVRHRAYK